MKKLKIYLDTSIISYLDQGDAPEKMAETHRLWDQIKAGTYIVVISDIDIIEIDSCEEEKKNTLRNYLAQIKYELITSEPKAIDIASRIVDLGILKQKSFDDCQHIANAIVSGCDAIVSWNFKHIVNHKTMLGIKAVTALEGYNDLLIYAPPSLTMEGEESDTL
jgi:predicted nucleic acid-binding protein